MTKSKSLRIIICVLLLAVVLCFSACASVRTMTVSNEDGTIDELVYVTLNEEEIEAAGYTVDEMKNRISTSSLNEAQQIVYNFNMRISRDINSTTDSETIFTLNSFINGINVVGDSWEDDTYVIGIRFKNSNVYRYYYGISDESSTKTYTEEHFFYNRIYYYGLSMYVDYSDLYQRLNAYYSTYYPNLVDSENNELLYTYITDLRREHSDANYITELDGKYYHTWVIDQNNIDQELVIYYNIANRANCMLVLLGCGILISGILLLIAWLINRKNNKKEDDIIQIDE